MYRVHFLPLIHTLCSLTMVMSEFTQQTPSRRTVVRQVLIFQVKLWLEGFKDIVLMPLSLGAALIDLVFRGGALYSVMRMGDRFEQWVDLYAALENSSGDGNGMRMNTLDSLLHEAADELENRSRKNDSGTGNGKSPLS